MKPRNDGRFSDIGLAIVILAVGLSAELIFALVLSPRVASAVTAVMIAASGATAWWKFREPESVTSGEENAADVTPRPAVVKLEKR